MNDIDPAAFSTRDGFQSWLAALGVTAPAAALRELLRGVAAAPPSWPADAWFALLPDGMPPAARPALQSFIKRLRRQGAAFDATRLPRLRAALAESGLDGFFASRNDEHPGTFLPAAAERVEWLSGFTGSAGFVVVLRDRAALFTDGRYQLQARQQLDTAAFEIRHAVRDRLGAWFKAALKGGERIGYDPRLLSAKRAADLEAEIAGAGGTAVAVEENPIDRLWTDRPARPLSPAVPHELRFAGRDSLDKRREIAARLAADGTDAFVLAQPESVAWLLNLRGQDVPNTPLALAFAVVHADARVDLYVDPRKLLPETRAHLGNAVAIHEPQALAEGLDALGKAGRRVGLDPNSANAWIKARLAAAGARLGEGADPCLLPRARKNETEIEGSRAAHRRDGRALIRFLRWVEEATRRGAVTEYDAGERTTALRAEGEHFRGTSFYPIVGSGPNSAVIHYRPTPDATGTIKRDTLLLVDSGGQYLDGTTDITRTIAIGTPTAEMRRLFTLVLKGHIALARARFPAGANGSHLDALARQFLWQEGLDFDHGTGHGVGSYLGVHEGPQNVSALGTATLDPGMILSDEPGYYRADAFGIRIENLVLVRRSEFPSERPMLEFEVLSLVPIDRNLVERALMTDEETAWLDAYHARVLATHQAELAPEDRAWLARATAPLG